MKLSELRTAIRVRCGLTSDDPIADDSTLTLLVNGAIHWVERQNPKGWQWLRVSKAYTAAGGEAQVPVSVWFAATGAVKVRRITVTLAGGVPAELERVQSRFDVYDVSGASWLQAGIPKVWAINGGRIHLAPGPVAGLELVADGIRYEEELSGDDDEPLMPAIYHEVIVERAAAQLFRRMHNLDEAAEAERSANQIVREMRSYDVPYTGPGRIRTQEWMV